VTRRLLSRAAETALVIAIAMAGGCYESDSPLDPAPGAEVDEALLGTWRCLPLNADANEPPATMSVTRAADRRYGVTWRETDNDPVRYEAFASSVDGQRFLNVRERKTNGPSGKWMFVRPRLLQPDVLQVQIVDAEALKGVPDSPAAVRRAIARQLSRPSLTVDFCVCARAKQATERPAS
jgi:hypothetical protein